MSLSAISASLSSIGAIYSFVSRTLTRSLRWPSTGCKSLPGCRYGCNRRSSFVMRLAPCSFFLRLYQVPRQLLNMGCVLARPSIPFLSICLTNPPTDSSWPQYAITLYRASCNDHRPPCHPIGRLFLISRLSWVANIHQVLVIRMHYNWLRWVHHERREEFRCGGRILLPDLHIILNRQIPQICLKAYNS